MGQAITSQLPDPTCSPPLRPYPPSWIDRLLAWLDRLPISILFVLIGLWIVLVTLIHITAWHQGIMTTGQLDARILVINTWIPYGLGFIFYLKKAANDALTAFRPALPLTDDAFDGLRYRFTVMPQRGVLISIGFGALLAFVTLQMYPEDAAPFKDTLLVSFVSTTLSMAGAATIMTVIYYTFRQLRLIRQTYAQASRLDLFHTNELNAFSSLALRPGIGWLIILYAGVLFYPALGRNITWVVTSGVVMVGVAISFVTTLGDIHQRIASVKAQRMQQIDERLQAAFDRLHQCIDGGEHNSLGTQREVMDALLVERGLVVKLPTWPWQSGTLASFLTAVFLPVIVWFMQAMLQRLLGL